MTESIYADGTYGDKNPDWHSADSGWKAEQIAAILTRNNVAFQSCVEVGCGSGLILEHLAKRFPEKSFAGYDVSPDAAKFWSSRSGAARYNHADFTQSNENFDVLLLIDVFEHVDDYLGFLRKLRGRAKHYVFHIPLDLHVSGLLRDRQIHARQQVGHIHYFSRATALATLTDTGYTLTDEQLTKLSQETVEGQRGATKVANIARRSVELVSPQLAARLLGGYSLLALCT